jgi:hypothetical protein
LAVDTTQATASNRAKVYVNGTEITAFGTAVYPTLNYDSSINNNVATGIGDRGAGIQPFSGYLADIHFIDGQALTPSSFGETDATTGEWIPKAYTGTYGTNGFHLDFADNSSNTATTLGKDTSGNSNNWTPNNLSVIDVKKYSQNYVANTPSGNTYYSDGWTRGFNSDLSDGVLVYNNEDTTLTLPSGVTWSSKIRIRLYQYGGAMIVNGVTLTGSFTSTPTWYDFTSQLGSSGTLNTIKVTSIGSNYTAFCAVELDNVVLYDNNSGNDSLVDTPTSYGTDTGVGGEVRGNYCTWNPLDQFGTLTLTNGNLDVRHSSNGAGNDAIRSTLSVGSGKWYYEVTPAVSNTLCYVGLSTPQESLGPEIGNSSTSYACYLSDGTKRNSNTATAYGSAFAAGDVMGVAFDMDAGKIWFSKNGTWFASGSPAAGTGEAFSGITGLKSPALSPGDTNVVSCNFGQRPFAYTAPSGFKALCDTNLPTPTIVKPSTVMDVKLYTGNGSTQTISGLNFSPDLVWIKERTGSGYWHALYDVIRGANTRLSSNTTDGDNTTANSVTSFNSDGFSLGSYIGTNDNTKTFAAWCWDAGSSTVTNTSGTIQSSVRANASAGFSIVTYTGTGSAGSIGHGLGVAPKLFIVKNRSAAAAPAWPVLHTLTGVHQFLDLSSTNANGTPGQSAPTSSVVYNLGDGATGANGNNYVMYCFAPVAGYSAFGSYTGNGSADGPFVYTGFRPRWVMVKATNGSVEWFVYDTARSTYNDSGPTLRPNSPTSEASFPIDILSNGFKLRYADAAGYTNYSTFPYIYAAFAEFPFQYARAR